MIKTYKFRLDPTKAQKELLAKHFGAVRFIYNLALQVKKDAYNHYDENISWVDLCKQLTDLKNECTWLKEINAQSLQSSIRHLDEAYKNFFNHGAGFPKFKRRSNRQSFQCPQKNKIVGDKISINKFREGIKIKLHRKFIGDIKTVTISITPTGKYYASILVDNHIELPETKKVTSKSSCLGIDTGIKTMASLSNGTEIENPKFLKRSLARLKILQRRADKKKKGSKNQRKANLKTARLHEKVKNQRNDYIQKQTTKLLNENQVEAVMVEDLAVSNLMKNHSVAQALSDVSISRFYEVLKYKCKWRGINFVKVGRFYASTKICNCCQHNNDINDLKIREWTCVNCNTPHDRDYNASLNIRDEGYKILTGREPSEEPVELPTLVGAKKQEANQL